MMFDYVRGTYMFSEGIFYNKKGEYNKSLEYIEKGLDIIGENKLDPNAAININTLKSDNLHQLGKDDEAYKLLKSILQKKDSIDNRHMSSQVIELQTIYEVNKIRNDMEVQSVQLERTKVITIALICLLFLLLLLIFITRKNRKEREKKNKKIHEQYELMKSYLEKIRIQRDQLVHSREIEESEEAINWAERAHNYLIETEAFRNENLSRDDLAIALGTNRQYLIDAIKEETGKTFKDYVNAIRIEYAYEMLIKDWGVSVERIYLASGFTTRSTFNRLFKEQYGMNPVELREIAKQKEEQLIQEEDI